MNERKRYLRRKILRYNDICKYTEKTVTTALQTAISIEADTAMIPVEKYSKLR